MKKTPQKLYKYYNPESNNVVIEDRLSVIKSYYNSRVSICWGQHEIGDTGYFQLVDASPRHMGDKGTIIVCSMKKLEKVKNG